MPKLKTNKSVKKRLRLTKRGKVVGRRAGKSHLMSGKTGKKRRAMKRRLTLAKVDQKRYARALGK
jgi:large subunit ribosomal protein L35